MQFNQQRNHDEPSNPAATATEDKTDGNTVDNDTNVRSNVAPDSSAISEKYS